MNDDYNSKASVKIIIYMNNTYSSEMTWQTSVGCLKQLFPLSAKKQSNAIFTLKFHQVFLGLYNSLLLVYQDGFDSYDEVTNNTRL